MAYNNMKRSSTSLVIKKMKIQTPVGYYNRRTRMSKIIKGQRQVLRRL